MIIPKEQSDNAYVFSERSPILTFTSECGSRVGSWELHASILARTVAHAHLKANPKNERENKIFPITNRFRVSSCVLLKQALSFSPIR